MSKKVSKNKKTKISDKVLEEIFKGHNADEARAEIKKRGMQDKIVVIGMNDYNDICSDCEFYNACKEK